MGEIRNDPSMEDILASIKRIIAEDGATIVPPAATKPARKAEEPSAVDSPAPEPETSDAEEEEVLELTQPVPAEPTPAANTAQEPLMLSMDAATASRHALSALSTLLVRSQPGQEQTLEALVREMLRPMLKDWLDAKLPGLVEELVQREIKRITGQGG